MTDLPATPRRGGSWTKVVIFVSLYVLLLESLIEWVLVLYLYGNRQVDSKMSPSLILILVASFLTVPLVILHSLLAWRYNKVHGFGRQNLHTVCTYLLRLTTIVWVAASVAGLVVISQQISCLPDSMNGSLWKTGVSCALHRAAVIVSVLSFITICLYFCSRELCSRPYDVSLLGVYSQRQPTGDGGSFSQSSFESENSLKDDIYYLCRGPDVTCGTLGVYISSSDTLTGEDISPAIQHPSPIRPKSLRLETDLSYPPEILSGTTIASPVSRTPTVATLSEVSAPLHALAELPGASEVPQVPPSMGHTRKKSSVPSLRRFLPKFLPLPLPLSADPQIRALAAAEARRDIEKQAYGVDIAKKNQIPEQPSSPPSKKTTSPSSAPSKDTESETHTEQPTETRPRSATTNSAEAPEVLVPAPVQVRRFNTPHAAPSHSRSASQPRRSTYMLIPPNQIARRPVNRAPSRRVSLIESDPVVRRHTHRRQSQMYHLDPTQLPRPRSQHHRPLVPLRRNDIGILYPGVRWPRSSAPGLDSIRETGPSVDETRGVFVSEISGRRNILDRNYRGVIHGIN